MEDEHGIYDRTRAEKANQAGGTSAPPALDPRPKMWRTFFLFVFLMLALLGVTSYFLYLQEKEQEEEPVYFAESTEGEETGPGAEKTSEPGRSGSQDPEPVVRLDEPLFNFDEDMTAEIVADPTADLDSDKIVEAMREARVAADHLSAREFDSAEMHARKALQIWPDMNIALRLLGVVYFHHGRFDDSIVLLERALEDNPFSPEIFNNMGLAYLQKGEYDRAGEMMEIALDLNPDFYVTSLNLGFLYLAMKRFELAAEYIESGLDKRPGDVNARNNLAVALLRLHRYEEARQHLQQLVNSTLDAAYPYFNMAITYVMERNFDAAMEWIYEGSKVCALRELQEFLADPDFDDIRSHPPFMAFIEESFSPGT